MLRQPAPLRLFVGLVLIIGLAACQSAAGAPTSAPSAAAPTQIAGAATAAATGTAGKGPTATAAPAAAATSVPAPKGFPPQTSAAAIQPPERRAELERLTNLLTFKVVGLDNAPLGSLSDFVINTCETFVIYFALDPDPALKITAGKLLIIPFESVTINSGVLDAAAKTISLHLAPSQVAAAPASPSPLALFPNTWEQPARDYWQNVVRVGKLSSACAAGGGPPIYKIAYAKQLIGAQLKDGNHNLLGAVTELIVSPESGKVDFYVVNLQNNQGLILLQLAKTNIPDDALKPGATIELVLLANPSRIAGAPRLANAGAATDDAAQGAAIQYWGR